jgi:hypothetical protein
MRNLRKKVWIHRFQTHLVLRIAFYFICYQVAVWCLVFIEQALSVPLGQMIGPFGLNTCFLFMTLIVVGLGILFTYDALIFAHSIVGPLYRLRQAIKALAEGQELRPIAFRKGDFLQELAGEFNDMVKALEQRGAVRMKDPAPKKDEGRPVTV